MKIKWILGGFVVTLWLRNFHVRWSKVNFSQKLLNHFFVKSWEYHPNASDFVHSKGILNWIKNKWIFFLSFAVTFILENFHREGEVMWPFFQKTLDNFLWKFGNSILMPLTLCTQKEFLIESNLNGFFFLLHLDLKTFIGEREHFTR